MEPRCCHLSRRFSDSNHSSCSMRQQIGKWLFVSNTSALIHWGILFPLTLKVKYAEFSSFFQLRLAEEIHSTQEHKWLHEFAKHFGNYFSDSTVRLYTHAHIRTHVVYTIHIQACTTLTHLPFQIISTIPQQGKLTSQHLLSPNDMNIIKATVNTHYIISQWFPFYIINYPC